MALAARAERLQQVSALKLVDEMPRVLSTIRMGTGFGGCWPLSP